MSHSRLFRGAALLAAVALSACTDAADRPVAGDSAAGTAAGTAADTIGAGSPLPSDSSGARSRGGADSAEGIVRVDVQPDSLRHETVPGNAALAPTTSGGGSAVAVAGDSAAAPARTPRPVEWPAPPTPLPGALLPANRIVAYYGNPLSKRMGILGEIPPDQMMAKLERTVKEWEAADTTKPVLPALHLIATVAQGKPGRDGLYRLRMSDSIIERVAGWAEQKGWLLFLDIQPSHSTVEAELPPLLEYLKRPYVHLGLDPEFAMTGRGDGALPGKKIGTLDAREINWAIDTVAKLVTAYNLPPKVLVIHRFTERMITNYDKIRRDPRVQVVIDMDGFGPPSLKKSTWRYVISREPVQYTGVKLFYKNDKPLLTPSKTLETFKPEPVYIQYQ